MEEKAEETTAQLEEERPEEVKGRKVVVAVVEVKVKC
jgi:hypothetical protein